MTVISEARDTGLESHAAIESRLEVSEPPHAHYLRSDLFTLKLTIPQNMGISSHASTSIFSPLTDLFYSIE
jgi:hypothetical protein